MKSWILRLLLAGGGLDALVRELGKFLSGTVHNRESAETQNLIAGVRALRELCNQFLTDLGAQ